MSKEKPSTLRRAWQGRAWQDWQRGVEIHDRWRYVRRAEGWMPWGITFRVWGVRLAEIVSLIVTGRDMLDAEMRQYARLPADDWRGKLMREALFWIAQGDTPDALDARERLGYCWGLGIGGQCREQAAAWWFWRVVGERLDVSRITKA